MEKVEFENQLFEAIKKDDLKSFSFLMPTNADLNLCFGRFPILSLLYLYSSFKILSVYEKTLLPIHNFKQTDEKFEMYNYFKQKVGKIIRLFNDEEIVYPVLMLACLNEKIILNNNYKFLYVNVEIVEKFKKIYNLTQKNDVIVNENYLSIRKEKLNSKHYLLFAAVAVILSLFIAFSSVLIAIIPKRNGLGTESSPIKISTSAELICAIDKGKGYYVLNNDIEIDTNLISSNDFSGVLDGDNYSVKINGEINKPLIKTLSGIVKNLEILLDKNDVKITQNSSIISEKVLGNVENVKISGKINIEYNGTDDVYFALIASENEGTVSNCSSNVSGNLINKNETNTNYSNFVGVNKENGKITNCSSIGGTIQADTVDLAGIASENYGEISSCENKTELIQTSSKEWHPNVAGIVMTNYGKIDSCKNYALLSAESTLDVWGEDESGNKNTYFVYIGGIACLNQANITNCRNFGLISANGIVSSVMAGGIVAQNYYDETIGYVDNSLVQSNIMSYSKNAWVYVGGVAGFNSGYVISSGFVGDISANSDSSENETNVYNMTLEKPLTVIAGGVVGINNSAYVQKCYADVNFLNVVSSDTVYKNYAGVIGCVGVLEVKYSTSVNTRYTYALEYVVENYFVTKNLSGKKLTCGYEIFASYSQGENLSFTYSSGSMNEITDTMINSCYGKSNDLMIEKNSLDEIPAEVRINE